MFHNILLSSILAKCILVEKWRGDIPPTSPKGLVLKAQADFCVYRGRFCLKFLSLLLTGKIRIGVTERGSLKAIRKWCVSRYSKVKAA